MEGIPLFNSQMTDDKCAIEMTSPHQDQIIGSQYPHISNSSSTNGQKAGCALSDEMVTLSMTLLITVMLFHPSSQIYRLRHRKALGFRYSASHLAESYISLPHSWQNYTFIQRIYRAPIETVLHTCAYLPYLDSGLLPDIIDDYAISV
jgi:hypothetical protein